MMPRAIDIARNRCAGSAPTIFEVVGNGSNRRLPVFDDLRAQRRLGQRLARNLRSPERFPSVRKFVAGPGRMRGYAPCVNGRWRPVLHKPVSVIWLRLPAPLRFLSVTSHAVRQRKPGVGASCPFGNAANCTKEAGNRRPWRDGCYPDRRVMDLDTGPGRKFRLRSSIDPCPIPMTHRNSVIPKQLRITLFDRIC